MADLVAGKRDRMVWASLYQMVKDCLELLGWFDDPTANSLDRKPVAMPWEGWPDGEKIPVNAIVVMPEDTDFDALEIGSNAEERRRIFIIDIYAESHAIGVHLRGDISAILRGQLAAVARDRNVLDVYDYDMATPAVVATMDIENVREDRAQGGQEPWERYWYSIMFVVLDEGWD